MKTPPPPPRRRSSGGWVPDAASTSCQLCDTKFSTLIRRHHCRRCGALVCSKCSEQRAPPRYKDEKAERCCDACWEEQGRLTVDTSFEVTEDARVYRMWEHQRWTRSWAPGHLLPLDPTRFVAEDSSDKPTLRQRISSHIMESSSSWTRFPADLEPPRGGCWIGDWKIDFMAAACDADGWSYALDFPELKMGVSYAEPFGATFVRRRRWAREWSFQKQQGELKSQKKKAARRKQEEDDLVLLLPVDTSLLVAAASYSSPKRPRGQSADIAKKKSPRTTPTVSAKKSSPRAATPPAKKSPRRTISDVAEDNYSDDDEDDEDKVYPAVGVVSIRPLTLTLSEGSDEERDLYVRTRVRSPSPEGGWHATRWVLTATAPDRSAHQSVRRLQGGAVKVAVTNPRSVVDMEVVCADSESVLSETHLTVFEMDPTLENDAFSSLVDCNYRWSTKTERYAVLTKLSGWATTSPTPDDDKAPKVIKEAAKGGGSAGRILVDGSYRANDVVLMTHRAPLPMKPAPIDTLSTAAIRDLAARVTAILAPLKSLSAKLAPLCSFDDDEALVKPLSALALFLCFEIYVFDATTILALPPMLGLVFLFTTLRQRASGRWAKAWITRKSPTEVVPWLLLDDDDDDDDGNDKVATEDDDDDAKAIEKCEVGTVSLVVHAARGLSDGSYRVVASFARLDDDAMVEVARFQPATATDGGVVWDAGRSFEEEAELLELSRGLCDDSNNPWLRRAKEHDSLEAAFGVTAPWAPPRTPLSEEDERVVFETARHFPVMQALNQERRGLMRNKPAASWRHVGLVLDLYEEEEEVLTGSCTLPLSDLVGGGIFQSWLSLGEAAVLVTAQLSLPTQPTPDSAQERSVLAAHLLRRKQKVAVDDDEKQQKRGPLAELVAMRAQVLNVYAEVLYVVSFVESALNLLCWVQPRKTLLLLAAVAVAAAVLLYLPLRGILIAGTLAVYWDAYLRAKRKHPAQMDARCENYIRSVPDAADLASYFAPRTRRWLEEQDGASSKKSVFSGSVLKTSFFFMMKKKWQTRYVVIDDERRILWWEKQEDAAKPAKGTRQLAPAAVQRAAKADSAPPGFDINVDFLIPYVELAPRFYPGGGQMITHHICAASADETLAIKRALYDDKEQADKEELPPMITPKDAQPRLRLLTTKASSEKKLRT